MQEQAPKAVTSSTRYALIARTGVLQARRLGQGHSQGLELELAKQLYRRAGFSKADS